MAELIGTTSLLSNANDLDKWIEILYDCKPLTEADVKNLCEQVNNIFKVELIIML